MQEGEWSDGVNGSSCQVPRARDSTNRAIAKHRAATAGESKSSVSLEESEHVLAGVLSEAAKDGKFMLAASAQ